MALREKAVRGIIWSIAQKWGREGISFLTFLALSRLLAPEAFGLVALAVVFTAVFEIFLDQGLAAAIVQRNELEPEHLDTAFWITVFVGLVLTGLGIASSNAIAAFLGQPQVAPILRWLSLNFLLSALSSVQIALLQRDLAFKSLAIRSLVATGVGGVVGISMALAGFGVWSLIAQTLANGLAGVVVLWQASDWRPGLRVSSRHYRELFSFGAYVVGNNLLKVLMRRSDDFLIGYFLGPTLLGYYTVGYRLLLVLIRVVTGIINSVAFPTFSRLQAEPVRLQRAFYRTTQYTSLLAFPVFIGLAVLAPEVVPALFGRQWMPSIPVMQILAFIGILQSILAFNMSVLRASGKPSWELGIMLLNTVFSILGFLVAVRWGIVAVAASFVLVGYILAPVSYWTVNRVLPLAFQTYLSQFVPPLAASAAMVAAILGVKALLMPLGWHPLLSLALYVAIGGLAYLTCLILVARSLSLQILD
ncbi:sugar isomerase, partial [Litorilinea aerophila]